MLLGRPATVGACRRVDAKRAAGGTCRSLRSRTKISGREEVVFGPVNAGGGRGNDHIILVRLLSLPGLEVRCVLQLVACMRASRVEPGCIRPRRIGSAAMAHQPARAMEQGLRVGPVRDAAGEIGEQLLGHLGTPPRNLHVCQLEPGSLVVRFEPEGAQAGLARRLDLSSGS